ncbi:7-methylguanosine phosphate-specific 5'-nucleotidase [Cryptotermes secundus]|uniref:5'-nucleotidase n=2 Tax=Cryptotermes secundus TaxID=105785 RepID=A0A2J7QMJ2_9NEOP|nr:7-methylguanosine phosphate-specific 5'-nucleotidase isoform X2 [Cryptotermes secundus]XP_023711418.1 7-methylguanosine phosphate-specific 5'-nucleotidase isoform X2 [Cryptotermes secundus]XP_033608219.1 7-methylguanosine phosphate-specific 5'-nucleotidase isoform X2 [Cryptotermes secundus]PNF29815.1 7-methylguanosine phosphate-specific 5'-nucleotidase [Cryptotermes secundus]
MKELTMGKVVKLEDVQVLLSDSVRIRDRSRVEDMVNSLVRGGKEKLQMISDFDRTLTKQHVNGKPTLSSFCIFSQCRQLPSGYKEQDAALFQHYRPIEIDPNISREEKAKHMVDWYQQAQKLLRGFDFQTEELEEVIRREGAELREGTDKMLQSLQAAGVPVLVFSAGLGDSVSAVLRYHNVLFSNVHIISNYLRFDGLQVNGFQGDIIHSFNKNEHAIEKSDYFQILAGRNNVLLLGDEVGDAGMADGVQNAGTVLKIGFLYDRVEDRLEEFLKHFDIVLIDDQTMDIVNGILDLVP